ncbi:alpha-ketoglutarate-dependent dioxygenase AlkB family protein [Fulvimonas soli]|uniref:DNA-N1-methyladenine dioxygenase n=1 Tax=Fulvimonas soli TaxID=155197 RepID=A0A316I4S7_9GAMM|nr:alpha-ketoglutarate-dependent dioxygenase AlkB [Fulvimonas soli]PWK88472.1 DNA-N1-methyladenine dioxygenase [Fulvimonas soli]TNY26878.1 alpha-ketoglutarate-dependent dioxygenase AlkB [Fulvimonas soli]
MMRHVPSRAAAWEALPLPAADLRWSPHWLPADEADALFAALRAAIPWETHRIRLFGREVDSPRLSCWIGDADAHYAYSGTRFDPHPWPPVLVALRGRVEQACGARFNGVLANLYRDGRDGMGWHSDDEPELGPRPVIASLSLGAQRRFRLRRRRGRGEPPRPGDTLELALPHGSLLRMAGDTQRHYRHELPRTRAPTGARINLTFRLVRPPAARR